MENEIVVNQKLGDLLKNHGVEIQMDDEFVNTDLAHKAKFKARVVYDEVNNVISSRLDVIVITDRGDRIIESFGDFGDTVEEAVSRNFHNFSMSSLHPLLAALGSTNPETTGQIDIEDWIINDKKWKVYIGNLVPKTIGGGKQINPPSEFFHSIEQEIRVQKLSNEFYWFRSYYCQHAERITQREFLMNNEAMDADRIFVTLPILPGFSFYSCRNFIALRELK